MLSDVRCRLKNKLVAGKWPDSAPGNDERHRPNVAVQDLLEQMLDQLDVRRASERQSAGNGGKRQRPARDEQQVVGDLRIRRRVREVPPSVDAGQPSGCEACSDLTSQSIELEARDVAELERRRGGGGLVQEVHLRSEQLDSDVLDRELAKGEGGFEASDSTTGDEYFRLSVGLHRVPPARDRVIVRPSVENATAEPAIRARFLLIRRVREEHSPQLQEYVTARLPTDGGDTRTSTRPRP